ncbi:MAG: glycosyltransferase family 2 protein [Calothrix sp. SM1_7_51]|nr:glycosyltransferase family 2 protein [Calothrix sp. SM1_7_51]
MKPLITIIMPAYNAANYLSETIESVLNQSVIDWELLIIDDGSTDKTAQIALKYSQIDSRIKVISQSNQGVSVTRNTGIKQSQSEFIAFIDADDKWFIDKLERHIHHFTEDVKLGISFAKVEFLNSEGQSTGKIAKGILTQLQPHHFLYENPTMTVSNLVVRKEVFTEIGDFDSNMNYAEDLDFLLRVMCNSTWKIEGINQVLMGYRTVDSGLSSKLYSMELGWQNLISKATIYAPELVNQHYYSAQSCHLRYLARRAFRLRLSPKIGVDFMTRSLCSDWKIIFREPRRTLLTMLAVYCISLLSVFNSALLFKA